MSTPSTGTIGHQATTVSHSTLTTGVPIGAPQVTVTEDGQMPGGVQGQLPPYSRGAPMMSGPNLNIDYIYYIFFKKIPLSTSTPFYTSGMSMPPNAAPTTPSYQRGISAPSAQMNYPGMPFTYYPSVPPYVPFPPSMAPTTNITKQ
eukprot:CAMPEP_0184861958 /NCGR_PEP_ID=MMETSP0580-20130426/6521_1 /TAXON_ID=1118495 /ORGANISM="Dactyliosolen fragilissimus" /LENGTH=145 /DNA_ID=CAMNT_0027359641 /DNA_START=723 /DNA_END=1160 /DNA_ORIENTATION=-